MKRSIQHAMDALSPCKSKLSSIAWRNRVICKATVLYIQSLPLYNKPRHANDELVARHHGVSIGDQIGWYRLVPDISTHANIKRQIKSIIRAVTQ